MSSPSVDIAGLLNAAGIATTGTDMFVGYIPDTITGFAIQLNDFGGPSPMPTRTRDWKDVQIIVRGDINGYAAAWSKAEAIKNYLLGKADTTVGTNIYANFQMRSDITYTGLDPNLHPLISLNFRIVVDGPNTGNRTSI